MEDEQLTKLIDSINSLNKSVDDFHKYVEQRDETTQKQQAEEKAESIKQDEKDAEAQKQQLENETKFNDETLKKLESILQETKTANDKASENNNVDDLATLNESLGAISSQVSSINNQMVNPMGEAIELEDGTPVSTTYYKVSYLTDIVILMVFFFIFTPYLLYRLFIKPFMDVI